MRERERGKVFLFLVLIRKRERRPPSPVLSRSPIEEAFKQLRAKGYPEKLLLETLPLIRDRAKIPPVSAQFYVLSFTREYSAPPARQPTGDPFIDAGPQLEQLDPELVHRYRDETKDWKRHLSVQEEFRTTDSYWWADWEQRHRNRLVRYRCKARKLLAAMRVN